jgi:hypothetical protein
MEAPVGAVKDVAGTAVTRTCEPGEHPALGGLSSPATAAGTMCT